MATLTGTARMIGSSQLTPAHFTIKLMKTDPGYLQGFATIHAGITGVNL